MKKHERRFWELLKEFLTNKKVKVNILGLDDFVSLFELTLATEFEPLYGTENVFLEDGYIPIPQWEKSLFEIKCRIKIKEIENERYVETLELYKKIL